MADGRCGLWKTFNYAAGYVGCELITMIYLAM